MRKLTRFLMGGAVALTLCANLQMLDNKVFAATANVSVENASLKSNVYYTGRKDITLRFETSGAPSHMFISETEVADTATISSEQWVSYEATAKHTLKAEDRKIVRLYVYLKEGDTITVQTVDIKRDADIIPPKGEIIVQNANREWGIYYTNSQQIEVLLEAKDNMTENENLKMILVSGDPLTVEQLGEADRWEDFSADKYVTNKWVLDAVNEGGVNMLYLYLKDEAGNISPAITTEDSQKFEISYQVTASTQSYVDDAANNAELFGMPRTKKVLPGVAFNVAVQEPTLTGKYFWGWNETAEGADAGTVQWISDDIIEAKYLSNGKVLYAVFKDTAPKLADVVKVGEYVNFPVEYDNVTITASNNTYTTTLEGWRVLRVSGDTVDLVSAGLPLSFFHESGKAYANRDKLKDDFLNTEFRDSGLQSVSVKSAFERFSNYYTKVSAMDKIDLEELVGIEIAHGTSIKAYGDMVHLGAHYWLASAHDGTRLWRVGSDGAVSGSNGFTFRSAPRSFSKVYRPSVWQKR